MDNPFAGLSEMTLGPKKCKKLRNVIMSNVIWTNQKYESFVHRWQHTLDVICFLAFVGTSDVISSVLSIL